MEQPKTADGVIIRPGDIVWINTKQLGPFAYQVFVFDYQDSFWFIKFHGNFISVNRCYSNLGALIAEPTITDSDIVEFLSRRGVYIIDHISIDFGVHIKYKNIYCWGINVIDATKAAIIKERERETT